MKASGDSPTVPSREGGKVRQVVVLWDFDQFALWEGADVLAVYAGLRARMLRDGNCDAQDGWCNVAFGVPSTFAQPSLRSALTKINAEMRLVSDVKREETDRQLERSARDFARRPDVAAFVLMSSDQDFNAMVQQLRRDGKRVYVCHNAERQSTHEQLLSLFPTGTYHLNDLRFGAPCDEPTRDSSEATVYKGTVVVLKLNHLGKLFGVIIPDDGSSKAFLKAANISAGAIQEGSRVTYTLRPPEKSGDYPIAANVVVLDAEGTKTERQLAKPPLTGNQEGYGRVTGWQPDKKGKYYGYIVPESGGENIYVHSTAMSCSANAVRSGTRLHYVASASRHRPNMLAADTAEIAEEQQVDRCAMNELKRSSSTPECSSQSQTTKSPSPAPERDDARPATHSGVVAEWPAGQAFGYLICDGESRRVFAHKSALQCPLSAMRVGTRVRFSSAANPRNGAELVASRVVLDVEARQKPTTGLSPTPPTTTMSVDSDDELIVMPSDALKSRNMLPHTGVVAEWPAGQAFGYLQCDGESRRVFAHKSALQCPLSAMRVGTRVRFSSATNPRNPAELIASRVVLDVEARQKPTSVSSAAPTTMSVDSDDELIVSPPHTTLPHTGVVAEWPAGQAFGYLQCDGESRRVFAHKSALQCPLSTMRVGTRVRFSSATNPRNPTELIASRVVLDVEARQKPTSGLSQTAPMTTMSVDSDDELIVPPPHTTLPHTGVVAEWPAGQAFGYLKCDGESRRVFAHKSALQCPLSAMRVGTRVRFSSAANPRNGAELVASRVVLDVEARQKPTTGLSPTPPTTTMSVDSDDELIVMPSDALKSRNMLPHTGVVAEWPAGQAFGYLQCDGESRRVFAHKSALQCPLSAMRVGTRVRFSSATNPRNPAELIASRVVLDVEARQKPISGLSPTAPDDDDFS